MTSTNILSLAILFLTRTHTNVYGFSVNLQSFTTTTTTTTTNHLTNTALRGVIEAYDYEETSEEAEDPGLAAVQQAEQSASVLLGTVQTKGGQINPVAEDIKLYTKLTSQNDDGATTVLCKGMGTEVYVDPGDSTEKLVTLATEDAVRNALSDMKSSSSPEKGKICITFAGGDDLMVHEVLQGVELMTSGLDLKPGASVEFRSLCHDSFPQEKCGVAAVVVDEGDDGRVFWNQGEWWTVSEDDATDII